ncbi:MAG: acyl-CoA thioesterase [Solirubrobacteraceae bacterium]|nr:acyl-CoA thioesterase [Solirubrobacteraceae bacterium]
MDATLVKWMSPEDANNGGFVHGGVVMRLCDEVAGLAAMRHSRVRCVTAGIDRMTFNARVDVGELLTLHARVNAVWKSSMEVGVRVLAENVYTGEVRHTSSAYLTMVAIDVDTGRPVPVPDLPEPTDPDTIRRAAEAQVRRVNRLAERDQLAGGRDGA